MGGGDKPLIEVGGRSLFARAVAAVSDAGCAPIVAVGPTLDERALVRWVREDPPFAGPVAGIAAAMAELGMPSSSPEPEWVLLLAGDLPRVRLVVERLIDHVNAAIEASDACDAVVLTDGHPQWLAGIYRTTALRAALDALDGDVTDASCRALLCGLEIVWLTDDDGITADVDTPADLARFRAELEEEQ